MIGRRFEGTYRIRFDEAGANGTLRSSGYLRYAQDLAGLHSVAAGFDRDWYAQRGLQWLVRAIELEVAAEARHDEELRVSTEVIGGGRVWARRRTEVRRAGAEGPSATALIDWVLLNAAGRPVRVPPEIVAFFSHGAACVPGRVPLSEPDRAPDRRTYRVRPQDLDPLAHVNNAAYLDYVEEHLLAASVAAATQVPRRYRLEYLWPAEAGETITSTAWPEDGGWSVRLDGDGDRELLRARLEPDRPDRI